MKSLYNMLYLAIFLRFVRMIVGKFSVGKSNIYSVYLEGVQRDNYQFDLHVASSADTAVLMEIKSRLVDAMWGPSIVLADKVMGRKVYDMDDKIVSEYLTHTELDEIRSSVRGLNPDRLIFSHRKASR